MNMPLKAESQHSSDYDTPGLSHEIFYDPNKIGIATATFYPTWSDQDHTTAPSTDKIRGDLALETITLAQQNGHTVVVVDGGSSNDFMDAVRATGAKVEDEVEQGMSASRRQAFEATSSLEGVEIICWTEPEKISIVRDCMGLATQPIVDGIADIVIPKRDQASFATYPDYQAEFETSSNSIWNGILRRHNVIDDDREDLDAWIGPRFFRNDPEIVKLFSQKYQYKSEVQSGLKQRDPELWPNAIFLPVVAALKAGYCVASVDVPYEHPAAQTANEVDNDVFRKKRAWQQENILKTTIHFLRYLEDGSKSRLEHF